MALISAKRQQQIFRAVVREYIETAEPVGSETIVRKYRFEVSPATVRSDMVNLEELGYLVQPYTSAGRIPTETGYRYYVASCLKPKLISPVALSELEAAIQDILVDNQVGLKNLAKKMADVSNSAIVVNFDGLVVVAGLAQVFSQPEARDQNLAVAMSSLVDNLDTYFGGLQKNMMSDLEVFIGHENPWNNSLTSIATKFKTAAGVNVVSIIGPTRMDYDLDIALLNQVKDLLENNL